MRLVLISDTHNQQRSLVVPAGDALVHAGDFTMRVTLPRKSGHIDNTQSRVIGVNDGATTKEEGLYGRFSG